MKKLIYSSPLRSHLNKRIIEGRKNNRWYFSFLKQQKRSLNLGTVIAVGSGKILSNGVQQNQLLSVEIKYFLANLLEQKISSEYILIREDEALGII